MKFLKFLFIFAFLHLNAHGADYPRPQRFVQKTPPDFRKLPQALLSGGQPVDPFCIGRVLMQARGANQILTECAGTAKDVQRYMMWTSDAEKGFIAADAKINNRELGHIHDCSAQYEVIGILGTKVVLETRQSCTATYPDLKIIGIIEQKNNLLINDGIILQSYQSEFEDFGVRSFENGILRYRVGATASQIFDIILNSSPEDKRNPLKLDNLNEYGKFGMIDFKVDLNKDVYPLQSEVIHIIFDPSVSFGYPETTNKQCLLKTIKKFTKPFDSSVPAEKFSAFRAEVNQCIEPPLPAPKEDSKNLPGVDI